MRKHLKYTLLICTITLFISSCSSDDGSVFDKAVPSADITSASANGEAGTSVTGRVIFTSDATTQRRMYITKNYLGQGEMPFSSFDLISDDLSKVLKADGSIDLDGAPKKEIDFSFPLPVPDIDNGEIVYTFGTTIGKGDCRDTTKRLALGAGQFTETVGTGTNPAAEVKGNTETFFSLLNETIYRVNIGREFRAFWDLVYYYGASGVSADDNASFASTKQYDASFGFPIEGLQPGFDNNDLIQFDLKIHP